jgi:hypothetical protein
MTDDIRLVLNLGPDLLAELHALAKREGRSVHDQTVLMLERALQAEASMEMGRRIVDDATKELATDVVLDVGEAPSGGRDRERRHA